MAESTPTSSATMSSPTTNNMTSELTTIIYLTTTNVQSAVDDSFMFEIMAIVLGVVFFIMLIISIAFFVKTCRRGRRDIASMRSSQPNEVIEMFNISQDDRISNERARSVHQSIYGHEMRDEHDNIHTITGSSLIRQNGFQSRMENNDDSEYEEPISIHHPNIHNGTPTDNTTTKPIPLSPSILGEIKLTPINLYKLQKKTNDDNNGNHRVNKSKILPVHSGLSSPKLGENKKSPKLDEGVIHDYENELEKLRKKNRKTNNTLQDIPPARNFNTRETKTINASGTSKSKGQLVKQDSDYEDPDGVIGLRQTNTASGLKTDPSHYSNMSPAQGLSLTPLKPDQKVTQTHDAPEYSNLIIQGVVVKGLLDPGKPPRDYENESTAKALRKKGPTVPVKRSHTTASFDISSRPVIVKKDRTFSNSDLTPQRQSEMYLAMAGKSLAEDDEMYIPMELPEEVQKTFDDDPTLIPGQLRKTNTIGPKILPKPIKSSIGNFDQNRLLDTKPAVPDKPPPCGKRDGNSIGYVNYEENTKYVNLFRSKSEEEVYVYADS